MAKQAGYKLLERYLGRQTAAAISQAQTRPETIGSVQPCVVLFADIRHFSLLTEQVSLDELRYFLSSFFQLFVTMIEKQGGSVNKFTGDGALALLAAAPPRQAAMAAATAALDLYARFLHLRADWARLTAPCGQVDLAVGISLGNVFLGNIGADERFDFTVIGTAVNVAQRLAADAATGGVYCCGGVQEHLGSSVNLRDLGLVQPRGMTKVFPLFQLLDKS